MVSAYNEISTKYNDLQASSDLIKGENASLSKKLKEAKAIISMQKAKLRKIDYKAKYYEDKSRIIKMFTIVKVPVEIMKDFTEGKFSSWDL